MPQFASRAFSTGPNKYKSSQDYTNQKTAETLYITTASNTKSYMVDNIQTFITPHPERCLESVGGFNTNSYNLLLNLTKGKYYATNNLLARVKNVDCSQNIRECVYVDISNNTSFAYPDYTYGIYEGPFMTSTDASFAQVAHNLHCLPPALRSSLVIDACNNTICNNSFSRLVSKEKLRKFNFPFKFKMTYP
jgi:hypothetical protein